MEQATIQDFMKLDIRVGTVLSVSRNDRIRNPSYVLSIHFGELGVLTSAAQVTALYSPEGLTGKQVIAVVNFPARQIADVSSECLVLGLPQENGEVVLLQPERKVQNGNRVS
jgi:tRNA-binding protein